MEQYLEIISVPAIAAVVYWVVNLIKYIVGDNEKFKKCIPLLATALGVVCGVVCYYAFPTAIPATNLVMAIVIGGASGLTATGANQVLKQFTKGDKDE